MQMNRILNRLIVAAACGLIAFPGLADEPNKDAETTKVGRPMKVPFKLLDSKHIVVQVKVNDKGPFRLVFDTGAPMMLLNNKIAKEAGVIKKETSGGFFNPFGAMGQFSIKDFEMGELKAKDVDCMVMDHPTLAQMAALFGPIDGIVGFPFFARYRMTVDYQAKELTFQPNDFKPTNIFESLMSLVESPRDQRNAPKILAPSAQWGMVADKSSKSEEAGIDISKVFEKSPAAKAGLKEGDRLLTLDGRWTDSILDLFEAVSHVKPGQEVAVQISRKGERLELKVTPVSGL
jgi:PDZ domain-containing protein/aspartyl protease